MKTPLLILVLALLGIQAFGQPVPTIATTTTAGLVKPDGTTITITSSGTISAVGGGGGPTNGITQGQFTAGLGAGTNTVRATTLAGNATTLGSVTVTNATTLKGATTAQAVGADSLVVTNSADLRGTTSASTLNVTNVVWVTLAAAASHTNVVFIDSSGHFVTNDLATFVASLGSGGGISHVYLTNDFIFSTNTVNHQTWMVDTNGIAHLQMNGVDVITLSTNALAVATGGSNYLGGASYVQTNCAPQNALTTTGGESSWSAGTLYTNRGSRALLMMDLNMTGGSSIATEVVVNFTNSGVGYVRHPVVPVNQAQVLMPIVIPLDPNATFKITTTVGSGGSVLLNNQQLFGQ